MDSRRWPMRRVLAVALILLSLAPLPIGAVIDGLLAMARDEASDVECSLGWKKRPVGD